MTNAWNRSDLNDLAVPRRSPGRLNHSWQSAAMPPCLKIGFKPKSNAWSKSCRKRMMMSVTTVNRGRNQWSWQGRRRSSWQNAPSTRGEMRLTKPKKETAKQRGKKLLPCRWRTNAQPKSWRANSSWNRCWGTRSGSTSSSLRGQCLTFRPESSSRTSTPHFMKLNWSRSQKLIRLRLNFSSTRLRSEDHRQQRVIWSII